MESGKEIKALKKLKLVFFGLLSMVVISPIVTNAKSFVNNNGIIISEEEYQNFLKMYSPEYIMVMNQEEYKKAQSIDYNNVETDSKHL